MKEKTDKEKVKHESGKQLKKWQTKMDEAKVQLHLGAKDAQDKLQPHIDKMEQEMSEAKEKWEQLEDASEKSWESIEHGLKISFTAMNKSFEKVKEHFKTEEKE